MSDTVNATPDKFHPTLHVDSDSEESEERAEAEKQRGWYRGGNLGHNGRLFGQASKRI